MIKFIWCEELISIISLIAFVIIFLFGENNFAMHKFW